MIDIAAGYKSTARITVEPRIEHQAYLTLHGIPSVIASGTLANHVAWSPSTGTIGWYTVAGFAPSAYAGRFVRSSSGLTSPIAKSDASGFRGLFGEQAYFYTSEPADGDGLEVLEQPRIDADVTFAPTGDGYLIVQGLDIGATGSDHSVQVISGNVLFVGSTVRGLDAQRGTTSCGLFGSRTIDCRAHGTSMLLGGNVHDSAGGAYLAADNGALIQIIDKELAHGTVQAGRKEQDGGRIVVAGGGALAIGDYQGAAMLVWPGGQVLAYDRTFILDAAPGAYGYRVMSGGSLYYVAGSLPAVYGASPIGTGYRLGVSDVAADALPMTGAVGAVFEIMQ